MFSSVDAARAAAKRLMDATVRIGRPLRLTYCQAVVASACGFGGWPHLAKTLGTPHEPGGARDRASALERFGSALGRYLPEGAVRDPFPLFAETFGRGMGSPAGAAAARVSGAVRVLPASEDFGSGIRVFSLDSPASSGAKPRRWSFPVRDAGGDALSVEVALVVDVETADTCMPMREVRAWIRRGTTLAGCLQATLYVPRTREGVSRQDAAYVADIVSDADLWTVLNMTRAAGPYLFDEGVAALRWWEMAPGERGAGLGTAFLRSVLADLKRRHGALRTLALDPDTTGGAPDFASLADGAELLPVARRKLRAHVQALDLGGCLGPHGRILVFDNARLGGPMETSIAAGAVSRGMDEGEGLIGELAARRRFDAAANVALAPLARAFLGKRATGSPSIDRPESPVPPPQHEDKSE